MVDYKSQREEIRRIQQMLKQPGISHHRYRDLKRYLGRLHKELSEAKKWQRGEIA